MGFPSIVSGKETDYQCRRHKRLGFDPCIRKIPWKRTWQPTPVLLPRESHGQRTLAGYSAWGCGVGHNLASEHACRGHVTITPFVAVVCSHKQHREMVLFSKTLLTKRYWIGFALRAVICQSLIQSRAPDLFPNLIITGKGWGKKEGGASGPGDLAGVYL